MSSFSELRKKRQKTFDQVCLASFEACLWVYVAGLMMTLGLLIIRHSHPKPRVIHHNIISDTFIDVTLQSKIPWSIGDSDGRL